MFSPREHKILNIIGRRKKISIQEITNRLFNTGRVPLNPNIGVSTAIKRINKKCEYYRLPWFLNGMGSTKNGRFVWKDKR